MAAYYNDRNSHYHDSKASSLPGVAGSLTRSGSSGSSSGVGGGHHSSASAPSSSFPVAGHDNHMIHASSRSSRDHGSVDASSSSHSGSSVGVGATVSSTSDQQVNDYDPALFILDVNQLKCPMCHNVCRDAVELSCRHRYCERCYHDEVKNRWCVSCPSNRATSYSSTAWNAQQIRNLIDGLEVRCIHAAKSSSGTAATTAIGGFGMTTSSSTNSSRSSPATHPSNHHTGGGSSSDGGLDSKSAATTMTPTAASLLNGSSSQPITMTTTPMAPVGCTWKGRRGDLMTHLQHVCLFVPDATAICSLCDASIKRAAMEDHRMNQCAYRAASCKHCGEKITIHTQESHSAQCTPRPCSHGCPMEISPRKMDEHSLTCTHLPVPCTFQLYGCQAMVLRKDVSAHVTSGESMMTHMQLMMTKEREQAQVREQILIERILSLEQRLERAGIASYSTMAGRSTTASTVSSSYNNNNSSTNGAQGLFSDPSSRRPVHGPHQPSTTAMASSSSSPSMSMSSPMAPSFTAGGGGSGTRPTSSHTSSYSGTPPSSQPPPQSSSVFSRVGAYLGMGDRTTKPRDPVTAASGVDNYHPGGATGGYVDKYGNLTPPTSSSPITYDQYGRPINSSVHHHQHHYAPPVPPRVILPPPEVPAPTTKPTLLAVKGSYDDAIVTAVAYIIRNVNTRMPPHTLLSDVAPAKIEETLPSTAPVSPAAILFWKHVGTRCMADNIGSFVSKLGSGPAGRKTAVVILFSVNYPSTAGSVMEVDGPVASAGLVTSIELDSRSGTVRETMENQASYERLVRFFG